MQNITSAYQYIFNKIPTNQEGFNNIINLRKNEVNDIFNKLKKNITDSKTDTLSINRQIYVLNVSSYNFFNMNSILTKNNKEASSILKSKSLDIYKKKGKQNNEYSLACRFYLENSLNGLQIEELYQPINDKIFVTLNSERFKDLISSNWIFHQDHFINKLNYQFIILGIKKSFEELKHQQYWNELENEIKKTYTKESIAQKISDQYNEQIKEITNDKTKVINQKIQEILNNLKKLFIWTRKSIIGNGNKSISKNFSKINETIKNYKDDILNNIKEMLKKIVYDFYNNMMDIFYKGRF